MKFRKEITWCICIMLLQGIAVGTANSQEREKEEYHLIVDSFQLPKAVIVDSVLYPILDSAISMMKFEPVNGFPFPYYLSVFPNPDSFSRNEIVFFAANWYIRRTSMEDTKAFYANCWYIVYRNYQIIVREPDSTTSWLRQYIQPSGDYGMYYIYDFSDREDKAYALGLISVLIRQEAIFQLWPGHRKPFSFYKYTYFIDDQSFIFDNEMVEEPKKKRRK